MQLRRLGRTNIQVSAVGFGTCQLRMVPESQAIDTLLRGFDLGVNIIHTAPDYEGAEDLVAAAVARTDRKVIVCSQAYDCHYNSTGPAQHFENLFEATCKRLRTDRLEMFGIACVDDREAYQENVWGNSGMIEFLQKKKEQGRLGGIFCTTHGNPEYIRKLIESDAFDAIMVAYNALGFHLLSYSPPPGRHFESLPRNRSEIFPLCRERDLGLMIMKPFAGGLLHASRAFPPRYAWPALEHEVKAADILRSILENEEVSCVVPGTASVIEAEENARAGHGISMVLAPERRHALQERVTAMQATICSRCGVCDALCSQQLKVSWLFRAAYVNLHPSETFETWDDVEYFRLHPKDEATCDTCRNITCKCPYEIDIPRSLSALHHAMVDLKHRGLTARGSGEPQSIFRDGDLEMRIVTLDAPHELAPCERRVCRVFVENIGDRPWFPDELNGGIDLTLTAFLDGRRIATSRLRHEVWRGGRCHFVFEIKAPARTGTHALRLRINRREARQPLRFVSLRRLADLAQSFTAQTTAGLTIYDGEIAVALRAPEVESQPINAGSSAEAEPFRVEWRAHNIPPKLAATGCHVTYLDALNAGSQPWLVERGIELVVRVNGSAQSRTPLPHTVAPGQCWTASVQVWFERQPGTCEWTFSLEQKADERGAEVIAEPLALRVEIEREPPGATSDALKISRRANAWFYWPSQGVHRSRDGRAYPLFIKRAKGCRITDPEGAEWIDYVMGWGSALLGYAHPEIEQAIGAELSSGAILSLPHELEMRVTAQLCDMIPCAETVLFGKNGSDVCTAAIRIARVHTGRRKVLFTGYHGWQDWYAEALEPALAPGIGAQTAYRFRPNDFDDFSALLAQHAGEVAAVILEPAAQVEGVDGPVADADPGFLAKLSETCRDQGIVLIFDEIMTGFRYGNNSVQSATGITPDLACFGKALTSSMPLSALVGRGEIVAKSVRAHFLPSDI